MSTSAPDGQPRSEIDEVLRAAGRTGPYATPPWVQASRRDESSNRGGDERGHRERGDGGVRRLVRWLIACGACAATLALIWVAGELWWSWDRATAVLVASTGALVVLAPFSWWASRELTTVERSGSQPPTVGHETSVSVTGNIGGSMITGDNNMIYTGGATSSPTAQRPGRPGVGEGAGSRRPLIAELHARTGGFAALGAARDLAFKFNGGHVQFFDRDDHQSFVIWLPPTGSGSVMPESVWEALCAVGDPTGEAEWPILAGLPVAGTAPLVIDDTTLRVSLTGGKWQGYLIREHAGQAWFWLPDPQHDGNASHISIWERDSAYEVRLRAIVDMAWHGEPGIRTLEECIGQLKAATSAGQFSNLFAVLGACFGVELTAPTWSIAKSNNNWAHGVHMTASLTDPDGQPAVMADVMLQVPGPSYRHSLLGCVDLHLNLQGLARLLRAASATDIPVKLELRTALRLLDIEIEDAAEILPGLVTDDPDHVRFAMPPFVVTKIQTGSFGPGDPQRYLVLSDVLDLDPLGEPTKGLGSQEAIIRIIGARGQDRSQRRKFLIDGLIAMAFGWGFAHAQRAGIAGAFDE